jgi:hypothetical protein
VPSAPPGCTLPPQNPSDLTTPRIVSALFRNPATSASFSGTGSARPTPCRFTMLGTDKHTSSIPW